MKITEFGTVVPSTSVKKRGGVTQAGNFSELLAASEAAETEATSQLSDVAATNALNNMLALQEISEEDVQRKKLMQQGKNMLDTLERLRQQLLIGTLPPAVLQDLGRQLAVQKQTVSDPKLMEIIEDIELRAAVELAKLETAIKRRNDPLIG